MKEIENWNGHRVLAIPAGTWADRDPVDRAYADAVWALTYDLGTQPGSRLCRMCPMRLDVGDGFASRCGHPRGLSWAAVVSVALGGCFQQSIIAEEYIPLVQMRLEGGS